MIIFDATQVNGKPEDYEKLARTIAEFMDSDMSMPLKENIREGWESDILFREQLEAKLVQGGNGKADLINLADVCKRARNYLNDPASRALLLLAGEFNALRRLVPPDIPVLEELLKQAEEEVDGLPQNTRKDRLISLLDYNVAIYLRDVKVDYELSRAAQKRAALKAKVGGDKVNAAIANFCFALDSLSLALQKGKSRNYQNLFNQLLSRGKEICETFTDETSTERTWKYLNVPAHVITSIFWANLKVGPETLSYFTGLLEKVAEVDPLIGKSHQSTIIACLAVSDFIKGKIETAMENIMDVNLEFHINIRVTVRLLQARVVAMCHYRLMAILSYRGIINGIHPMEQVRAIAERELVAAKKS